MFAGCPFISRPADERQKLEDGLGIFGIVGFGYEIDRAVRASYTIRREGDNYTVRIIEIFPDHKSYEKRFHY